HPSLSSSRPARDRAEPTSDRSVRPPFLRGGTSATGLPPLRTAPARHVALPSSPGVRIVDLGGYAGLDLAFHHALPTSSSRAADTSRRAPCYRTHRLFQDLVTLRDDRGRQAVRQPARRGRDVGARPRRADRKGGPEVSGPPPGGLTEPAEAGQRASAARARRVRLGHRGDLPVRARR